jgi:ABC-type multidrug transport system fused ATPase/permease subunit
VNGHISFKEVDFSYDHKEPVLRNLCLEVKPGEKVAIVGRSGVGKSTIINLLLRFYEPESGSILLDAQDIRKIRLNSLRKHIGLVSQETILFNSTIRENIQYGKINANPEEIIQATKKAHIYELINDLPQKFETVIGDRGVRLSGGERQRLSIARTILKDPKILVLDEAMSSLDTKSERLIQISLEPLMRNRSTIIIAHRLSTIVDVDRIHVLDQGRIIEAGIHQDLIQKGGIYKMLWDQMAKKENL